MIIAAKDGIMTSGNNLNVQVTERRQHGLHSHSVRYLQSRKSWRNAVRI